MNSKFRSHQLEAVRLARETIFITESGVFHAWIVHNPVCGSVEDAEHGPNAKPVGLAKWLFARIRKPKEFDLSNVQLNDPNKMFNEKIKIIGRMQAPDATAQFGRERRFECTQNLVTGLWKTILIAPIDSRSIFDCIANSIFFSARLAVERRLI